MKSVLIVMAFLAVASFANQSLAAPLPKEKMQACLKTVDSHLSNVNVPEEIKKMAEGLRSLNPTLSDLSLSKMIDNDSAELDAVNAGIVQESQTDHLVDICSEYTKNLVTVMGNTECGEELLVQTNTDYQDIMEGHDKLEELIGYAKACVVAL